MLAERVGLHEASGVERLSDGAFVSNQIEPGRTRQGADGSQIERQAAGWLAGWLAGWMDDCSIENTIEKQPARSCSANPFRHRFRYQNRCKIDQKWWFWKSKTFQIDPWSPKGAQEGPQRLPRGSSGRPRGAPRGPRVVSWSPQGRPTEPQGSPKATEGLPEAPQERKI